MGAVMGDLSREPSMEDILSSIRRVIARDEAPGARAQRVAAANEDVLDLHEGEAPDDAMADAPPVIPTEEELLSAASADATRMLTSRMLFSSALAYFSSRTSSLMAWLGSSSVWAEGVCSVVDMVFNRWRCVLVKQGRMACDGDSDDGKNGHQRGNAPGCLGGAGLVGAQCQLAQADVGQQADDLGGQPAMHEGLLARHPGQRDRRQQQA